MGRRRDVVPSWRAHGTRYGSRLTSIGTPLTQVVFLAAAAGQALKGEAGRKREGEEKSDDEQVFAPIVCECECVVDHYMGAP